MSKLEPAVEEVLLALERGLKALEVPFCHRRRTLDERPAQATLDADAVVFVGDLGTFERVKKELAGFVPDEKKSYRLHHVKGGRATSCPTASSSLQTDTGDELPVVTVPMDVLLKLVTYTLVLTH